VADIREMAYRHCKHYGQLTGARPIDGIETSSFGNPSDLFVINDRSYTIPFLNHYVRYCSAHRHIGFAGNETLVELGSGSGYQLEVLKKLYPEMTILCFDLPAQLFLCETYLTQALAPANILSSQETANWTDLSRLEPGKIHFFGSWQFPLVGAMDMDVFWNAASFGEMEPEVVSNYLSYIGNRARWIYLLQARQGKETGAKARVRTPIIFEDYCALLPGYELVAEQDAFQAHKRLSQSGGYFEAVWRPRGDATA